MSNQNDQDFDISLIFLLMTKQNYWSTDDPQSMQYSSEDGGALIS